MKKLSFAPLKRIWLTAIVLEKGYVFFEQAPVRIGKKTSDLLLQLVNPFFSGNLKVYFDPLAAETGGLSMGGASR